MRVAGLMSGTSLDGIDVAITDITGAGWNKRISVAVWRTVPYPRRVREAILAVSNREAHVGTIARLGFLLGELYASALLETCRKAGIPPQSLDLAGCHGQTIFHDGSGTRFLGRRIASTLQIGEAAVIAERLGKPVVADFRPRDLAAGGKGAPLVPYVDYLLFRHRRRGRVALNIGGIANITAIPPGAGPDEVIAFDTGPGNMVIDALVARFSRGRLRFDAGGRIAARGRLDPALLAALLEDRYFARRPPKTAGREQFGAEFTERLVASGLALEDLIATATAFTAAAVGLGIDRFVRPRMPVDELIVSGGGVHNACLMAYLAAFVPETRLLTSADFGIDPDAKEAIAFAVLAYETWRRRPGNLPSATGARRAVVLGKISP
jgi:anhydro-N-acetylmuramic acid kinase